MIYDYVIIFSFKDCFFKYRKQFAEEKQALQLIEATWKDHINQLASYNEAHFEMPDEWLDFAKVEGVEVIALHTIPFNGRAV